MANPVKKGKSSTLKAPSQKNHSTNKVNIPRVRKEFTDADYLKDLDPEARQWYEKFTGEYYGANLDFKKHTRKNLHKRKKLRKDCTDRNNRQNNDLFGVTKINGLLDNNVVYETNEEREYVHPDQKSYNTTEDALIELIDNGNLVDYDEKELEILERYVGKLRTKR